MKILLDVRLIDGEHITTIEPIDVPNAEEYKWAIAHALENEKFLEFPLAKNKFVSIKIDTIGSIFYEIIDPKDPELSAEEFDEDRKKELETLSKLAEEKIRESLKHGRGGIEIPEPKEKPVDPTNTPPKLDEEKAKDGIETPDQEEKTVDSTETRSEIAKDGIEESLKPVRDGIEISEQKR